MQLNRAGFTLIELSIVLVIIGLIVGGILTGQSLIAAAGVRATITQVEKYNAAAATFQGKYGYLPGDIPAAPAAQFGFASRGQYTGEGDGNGVLEGVYSNGANEDNSFAVDTGENAMFWVDLSAAHLIDGGFNTASSTVLPSGGSGSNLPTSSTGLYMPAAKIGGGNYIYTFSAIGLSEVPSGNYFSLSQPNAITVGTAVNATPGLTEQQAYSIDKKVDDGLPMSGNVMAMIITSTNFLEWATINQPYIYFNPLTQATAGSSTTCFDNGGVAGTQKYSLAQNNGAGVNCALIFRMQAGD